MNGHAIRTGITLLSVVALVLTGAAPASAQAPEPASRLTLPSYAAGIDVAADGTVYVVGTGPGPVNTVSVFAPDATTRTEGRTLTGLDDPRDVEVRPGTGEVFVANAGGGNVLVYEPGATTPNLAKTRTGVPGACALAFNQAGNLLVGSIADARIYGFASESLTPVGSFDSTVSWPAALTLHPSTGDLYVPDGSGSVVKVFDRGASVPNGAKTLSVGLSANPRGVEIHPANGNVYVSAYNGGFVSVFRPGEIAANAGNALVGVTAPWGVAVDPRTGRVYVGEAGGVEVFAAPTPAITSVTPATGPVTGGTTVTITGSNLGMVNSVRFGGVAGTIVGAPGYASLQVTTPSMATAGPVTVEVGAPGVMSTQADAFTFAPVAPGKPVDVRGVAGNGQVTVSWKVPGFAGGVPIESYTVNTLPAAAPCATAGASCIIGGLANGSPYRFTVTARNTAGLTAQSDESAAVTPVIALPLTVKATKSSYRPARWGTTTVVKSATTSKKGARVVSRSCANPTGLASRKLCTFTVKKGKVKVRTKGYRNVTITVTIQAVPKVSAGPSYGPSRPWTRTWRVR